MRVFRINGRNLATLVAGNIVWVSLVMKWTVSGYTRVSGGEGLVVSYGLNMQPFTEVLKEKLSYLLFGLNELRGSSNLSGGLS
jgi:hypothetical protein